MLEKNSLRIKTGRSAFAKRAFTMIELLIVVGVIAILSAIVLLGMRSITGRSKEQQTKLMLQNLRGMLAEYEAQTRFSKQPPGWFWSNGMSLINLFPGPDFWRSPFPPGTTTPNQKPLDAPGRVQTSTGKIADPSGVHRNAARQILLTQLGMRYILSVPANRKALAGIQSDKFFIPAWQAADIRMTGPDRVYYTVDDPPAAAEAVFYYTGNRVQYSGKFYRCVRDHPSPPPTLPPPSVAQNWVEEGTPADNPPEQPVPMLVDAWDNPILFVPASGLIVRKLNGESAFDPTKGGQTMVIVSPEGSARPAVLPNQPGEFVRAGKPFFASAGPDGDFTTGDDNIYSFDE